MFIFGGFFLFGFAGMVVYITYQVLMAKAMDTFKQLVNTGRPAGKVSPALVTMSFVAAGLYAVGIVLVVVGAIIFTAVLLPLILSDPEFSYLMKDFPDLLPIAGLAGGLVGVIGVITLITSLIPISTLILTGIVLKRYNDDPILSSDSALYAVPPYSGLPGQQVSVSAPIAQMPQQSSPWGHGTAEGGITPQGTDLAE